MQEITGLYRTPSLPYKTIQTVSSRADLRAGISNPDFLEAVFVANPRLHGVFTAWLETDEIKDPAEDRKLCFTAYKYLSRACCRSTPYGLFSQTFVSGVAFGNQVTEHVSIPATAENITEPDAILLLKIINALKTELSSLTDLTYKANNSVISHAEEIHYYKSYVKHYKAVDYDLTKVTSNEVLQEVLAFYGQGSFKTLAEGVSHLHTHFPAYEPEDITAYLSDMAAEGILVSNLDHCLIAKKPVQTLAEITGGIKNPALRTKWQHIFTTLATQLSNSVKNFTDKDKAVKDLLHSISVETGKHENLFHTERKRTTLPGEAGPATRLNKWLLKQLGEARSVLEALQKVPEGNLEIFKKEFKKRYGSQKMLLTDVMNPLKGIGYGTGNEDFHNLPELAGLKVASRRPRKVTLSSFQQTLHKILLRGENKIDLSRIVRSDHVEPKTRKESTSALAFIKVLNQGRQLFLRNFAEVSATRFLNRFGKIHPELENELEKICQAEESVHRKAGKTLVEFVHLPEVRMGNLLRFDHKRAYQTGSVLAAANSKTRNIPLSDIYIRLADNRLVLTADLLDGEIVPTVSNSLNPRAYPLNLYNFIYDLQSQQNYFDLYFDWGSLSGLFSYLPRVCYKDIIVSPASWKINKQEITGKKEFEDLKRKLNLPDEFYLGSSLTTDELLYINSATEIGINVFLDELRRKGTLFAIEILDNSSFISDHNQDNYLHELLIPLLNDQLPVAPALELARPETPDRFFPGNKWLYFKLYCTTVWAEDFLKCHLGKLTRDPWLSKKVNKWFFIRYRDQDGFHLRVRFKLSPAADQSKCAKKITSFFSRYSGSYEISGLATDSYDRELYRYGREHIRYCESLFHYDSEIILQLLENNVQDKLQAAIYGTDRYLQLFGISETGREEILEKLSVSYLREFNADKSTRKQMDLKYRALSDRICQAIANPAPEIEKVFRQYLPEMSEAATAIRTNKEETVEIAASLIHMYLNRLLTSRPRYNEMFIYYILAKHYRRFRAGSKFSEPGKIKETPL